MTISRAEWVRLGKLEWNLAAAPHAQTCAPFAGVIGRHAAAYRCGESVRGAAGIYSLLCRTTRLHNGGELSKVGLGAWEVAELAVAGRQVR